MTDNEKLLSIACFLWNEGNRVEEMYRVTLGHRAARYRDCDVYDLVELIQLANRLEYFSELSTVINNILFDRNDPRLPYYPLTGLRYDGII